MSYKLSVKRTIARGLQTITHAEVLAVNMELEEDEDNTWIIEKE